jgi:ferredoxin-NADP reductase/CRP-like cAMP-binding protein
MDVKTLLLKTGLFPQLAPERLDQLILSAQKITVPEGQIFIKEGEIADALYIIESGVCQVFVEYEDGHEIILARLETGEYFGEQALLTEIPGKRNANVRAISEMRLLRISHSFFQPILALNEAFKKKLQEIGIQQLQNNLTAVNLHKIYMSRNRGEVRQYHGMFLDKQAVITSFYLEDNRKIIATRVIDENIQSFQNENANITQTVIYDANNIHRELLLENNRLVGFVSYGEWGDIPQIINMIFNQTPLDSKQLEYFHVHGDVIVVLPEVQIAENDNEIICNCMYTSLGKIKEQIKAGIIELDAIGDVTGAGTVCGTCRCKIQDILGNGRWLAARIKKVLPLTPYIHAYQIVAARGEALPIYKAGQYVVMQCFIDGNWVDRTYTLTSDPLNRDFYEIAIQHEEGGVFSSWLFQHENEISLLRVSAPDGNFTPDFDASNPMVCLMAGIGITPAVAFARMAVSKHSQRPINIYFSAHTESDFAYLSELKKLEKLNSFIKIITRSTQAEGRLQQSDLEKITEQFSNAEYFICGPSGYEASMQQYLRNLGVPEHNVFIEKFTHSYDLA